VLDAYCREAGRGLVPLDVVIHDVPGRRVRLGLMHDPARPRDILAIAILEDRAAGRWIAGDSATPLEAAPAPDDAVRAYFTARSRDGAAERAHDTPTTHTPTAHIPTAAAPAEHARDEPTSAEHDPTEHDPEMLPASAP
jgi:hypothetical protein